MSSTQPRVYPRIRRRETHASRSVPAIIVAVVAVVALAYLVVEIVLAAVGANPLLASPATMVGDLAKAATVAVAYLVIGGVVLAILGLVLLVAALSPGRRARHVLPDDRAVIAVDDEVIASALVRTAADAGGFDPDHAVGSVSTRSARVTVVPVSGVPVDRSAVTAALAERVSDWGLRPRMKAGVRVARGGKVGS